MSNTIQDNIIDRDVLQAKYVQELIDSMDWKDMERFVYETIDNNLDQYNMDELIDEVSDSYPELLNCSSYSDTNLEATSEGFVGK